jgi:hypothetical protein
LNIRERINKFVRTHRPLPYAQYCPQTDALKPAKWRYLERIHTCLEAFYACTKDNKGYSPVLSDWFSSLHHLFNELDAWQQEARDHMGQQALEVALHSAWLKLEKYYKLTARQSITLQLSSIRHSRQSGFTNNGSLTSNSRGFFLQSTK